MLTQIANIQMRLRKQVDGKPLSAEKPAYLKSRNEYLLKLGGGFTKEPKGRKVPLKLGPVEDWSPSL